MTHPVLDPSTRADFKMKSIILELHKKHLNESLPGKTTYFTQYLHYLNPKREVSSCNIDGLIATYTSKLKWAQCLKPHPPNFEDLYNF